MAKQRNSLPLSARHKQPSLMEMKRRLRGPEGRQSTVVGEFCVCCVIRINFDNKELKKVVD